MNGLKPIKMPSAKEKVAAELRKAILSRQMKEGEVLSLESVATQLNVSAMPVREAFQILARDGLIQLRKNRGAVVLGITETYIKEHYQLRAILESAAASLAAEPETDISEIESVYEEAEEDLKEGNLKQYTDLNYGMVCLWAAWYQKRIMRKCRLKNMKGYGEQSRLMIRRKHRWRCMIILCGAGMICLHIINN